MVDESYLSQMSGKPWTKTFWAGHNINNCGEPIEDIAGRGELRRMRNIDPWIEGYVRGLLANSDES